MPRNLTLFSGRSSCRSSGLRPPGTLLPQIGRRQRLLPQETPGDRSGGFRDDGGGFGRRLPHNRFQRGRHVLPRKNDAVLPPR